MAPIYATFIVCFDLVGRGPPVERWRLGGDWDAGFGPSPIAADMDGTGVPDLVLSSRLGSCDRTRAGTSTSSELVLGRRRGSLYQAVADLSTGHIRRSVAWAPNGRGYRCARPYGLLTALPFRRGSLPGIVLVCCQVEEYLAVTRRGSQGSLRPGWSRFLEKDWPRDEQELRVHPDSCRDIDGDGTPELLASLWDGSAWATLVLDPVAGAAEPRARLSDRVHWGTLDRVDGGATLLVSVAAQRRATVPSTLELVDGATYEVLDRLDGASVAVGPAERLRPDIAFMADRRGLTHLRASGADQAVIRLADGSLAAWSVDVAGRPSVHGLGAADAVAVHGGTERPLLVQRTGEIRPLTWSATRAAWRTRQGMTATGRTVQPLVRATGSGPQLVVALADGSVVGGTIAGSSALYDRWQVSGSHPAPIRSSDQEQLLVTSTSDGVARLRMHGGDRPLADPLMDLPLDAPLDRAPTPLPDDGIALTLRTSTHTLATEVREPDGTIRWRADTGAYVHPPAAGTLDDGHGVVLLDDHGVLRRFPAARSDAARRNGTGGDGAPAPAAAHHQTWQRDWTAAYSMPVIGPFLPDGRLGILRTNGIHGLELLDATGRRQWRTEAELWRYSAGRAAVARLPDGTSLVAHPRRDGIIDGIEVGTGRSRWELPVFDVLEHAALAAGDLDGDAMDELLVGLPDGRLLCLEGLGGPVRTRWTVEVGAGIVAVVIADIDGDGCSEIVVGTVDGRVRMLR